MQSIAELFAEREIRAVWDNRTGKWWFCVADICAAIKGCGYQTARNYWKWLKGTWDKEQIHPVSDTNRMNFPAPNGRAHFTDVMDIRGVLRLIMAFPGPKAEPLRLWLADILAENDIIAEQFAQIGAKSRGAENEKRPSKLKETTVRKLI